MTDKRSKYDTDPLDPEFARRTEEIMGDHSSAATSDVSRERPTEHMPQPAPDGAGEQPTRRFEEATRRLEDPAGSYPSIFIPPAYQPPQTGRAAYTPPPNAGARGPRAPFVAQAGKPTSRHVRGLGLPENVALALPYAPLYVGLVASLFELILVPRSETRVRFHAAQGLALQLTLVAASLLFWVINMITGSGLGGTLFSLAANVFLVVSMIRVWQGERHHIAPLDDFTNQINQRFEPRKQVQ